MLTKNEVLAEAMNLSPVERAELIEALLSTLDAAERERLDELWGAESEDRISAYERGELTSTSLESVFEKVNAWKK